MARRSRSGSGAAPVADHSSQPGTRTATSLCSTSPSTRTSHLFACWSFHDDADREFGYTSGAEQALEKADTSGWTDTSPRGDAVKLLAEATLTVVLFADASRIDLRTLRREYAVPARLLGFGLPLTIAVGALLAAALFGALSVPEALVLAVLLAPTDAALGQAVVTEPRLPSRIRQGLNVESGLNDGICEKNGRTRRKSSASNHARMDPLAIGRLYCAPRDTTCSPGRSRPSDHGWIRI
jgi:Sodium/hydrogen exchanger family